MNKALSTVVNQTQHTDEDFVRIQTVIAESYGLPPPFLDSKVTKRGRTAAGLRPSSQCAEGIEATYSKVEIDGQSQSHLQEEKEKLKNRKQAQIKEKHIARMAALFGSELEDLRKNDPVFVGSSHQMAMLRDVLSL